MAEVLAPEWLAWEETRRLVHVFDGNDAQLRFVGGAVRDALLHRPVQDVDAATPLRPEQVMSKLLTAGIHAIPTGIAHGTVTAVIGKRHFEITTLRRDTACDGRHASVTFTDDWQADAARRDFTCNALYLAPTSGKVFDYFSGIADAAAGRIRFIGDPMQRIREDYLRILRFFRFHAWYGEGEPDTAALMACRSQVLGLESLSGERVRPELLKLLDAPAPHWFRTLDLMRDAILPALFGFGIRRNRLFERLADIELSASVTVPPLVRLCGFALEAEIDSAKAAEALCSRLKLSNQEATRLRAGVQYSAELNPQLPDSERKRLLRRAGQESFIDAVLLAWAHCHDTADANRAYRAMLSLAAHWHPPVFPVNGSDLIALGIKPGKGMGDILRRLEAEWEISDYRLTREELLAQL